jgi:hypothetical protein
MLIGQIDARYLTSEFVVTHDASPSCGEGDDDVLVKPKS